MTTLCLKKPIAGLPRLWGAAGLAYMHQLAREGRTRRARYHRSTAFNGAVQSAAWDAVREQQVCVFWKRYIDNRMGLM